MSDYAVTFDHDLYQGDLVGLVFLEAVKTQEGDITLGDTSAVGDFADRTDRAISDMQADAIAFWETGIASAGETTAKSGFSATTPFEYFDCFISDGGGGTGTWSYASADSGGSYVTGLNWAKAIWGWFGKQGYDTRLAAAWTWLMGFDSNATYETSASASQQTLSQAETGDYDPTLALATNLRVLTAAGAAAADNGSSRYDWATIGLTAGVAAAQQRGSFAESKRIAMKGQRRAYQGLDCERYDVPAVRGVTGLGLQVSLTQTVFGVARKAKDVLAACMAGLAFREQPRSFGVTDVDTSIGWPGS